MLQSAACRDERMHEMLDEITRAHEYLPGTTDSFASNEIIVRGTTAADVFENLIDTAIWPTHLADLLRQCN